MDGDSTNNDQGVGEYKKGDTRFWNGGDFKGITQKLDYIKELGVTGIWITPPVANQWRNPQKTGTGNHGYWASNFVETDKHYGTLEEYRELSRTLHQNEMYLIQDVVVNHLGDFYTYEGEYNPNDVAQNFKVHDVPQPTQFPFNHNDAHNPKDREMAIYHFAPNFHDHSDTIKKRAWQFADLDDLNTSNPTVRKALRESYNFWIKEVGVDGFRFDTPHMVEHEFWHDFLYSPDKDALGIVSFAKTMGKDHFLNFGETAVLTKPYEEDGTREAANYIGTKAKPEMNSILNFPLFTAIQHVFKELKPTSQLTYRLETNQRIFENPEHLCNFIDNHDGARFLSQSDRASFQQALLFIMTIPGIPVIYYGTEQELLGMRQSMFKSGAGSPNQDYFNTQNESFQLVQSLIELRKESPVFRRGEMKVLRDVSDGPGAFVYQLKYGDEYALVLFNTSENQQFVDDLATDLERGTLLKTQYDFSNSNKEYVVNEDGKISVLLSSKSGIILFPNGKKESITSEQKIEITPLDNPKISGDYLIVSGTSESVINIRIAINSDLRYSIKGDLKIDDSWSVKIPIYYLLNGKHRITAYSLPYEGRGSIISNSIEFDLENPPILAAEYSDKLNDDHGFNRNIQYATHPSFSEQADIESVKIYTIGTNLRVDLTMKKLTQMWLPPNGFDHVLVNIYIDLPNKKGVQVLPQQNYKMPKGGDWDYLVSTAGFGNGLFSSEGADENKVGKSVGPTASVTGDLENRTISFLIASKAMGSPKDLKGTKIYINTWDGSPGDLKVMNPEASMWNLGGGDENDPKILDDTEVIILNP
jgi:glycosidase